VSAPDSAAPGRLDSHTLDGVGTIDLFVEGDTLTVSSVLTDAGWGWTATQLATNEVEVVFSDGTTTVRFWARVTAGAVETLVQESPE
jgi:hypothetical protein